MKTDNLIVFCLRCGGHFKRNKAYQLKAVVQGTETKANLYICNGCYDAVPQTEEVKKMEIVK